MLQLWCLALLPLAAFIGCLVPFRRLLARSKPEILLLAVLTLLFLGRILFLGGAFAQKDANLIQIPFLQNYHECVRVHGQLPLWNPSLWLGMPSLAHPLLHAFHPTAVLAALLGAHAALGWGAASMLFFSCAGMLLFARELGLGRPAALVCAVAYGFNEFTLDRLGAATGPGIEYLYSYAFVPLSLAHLLRAAAAGRPAHGIYFGLSLVFVLNGNPNLFYYGILLCLIFLAGLPLLSRSAAGLRAALAAFIVGIAAMILVDAVELAPLYEFQAHARGSRLLEEASGWRMEGIRAADLGALLLPHLPRAHFGYTSRLGWAGLALAAAALASWRGRNGRIVLLMLILVATGVLLVTHSPLYALMAGAAPLFRRISMIPAVFILFVLPLSVLAGIASERLARRGAAIPLVLALLVFAEGLGASRGWIPWTRFTRLATFDRARELTDFPHLDAVADPSGGSVWRIECRATHYAMMCPDYAIAPRGLRLVNGDRYHFPGDSSRRLADPAGAARSLLDVRYVIAPEPLDDPALRLQRTVRWPGRTAHEEMALREASRESDAARAAPWDGTVYIYETGPHPHAFLVDEDFRGDAIPDPPDIFEVTSFAPAHIGLSGRAPRAGVLFLSEVFDAGWTATVDGTPAEVLRLDGGFLGVRVAEGSRLVGLRYQPASFSLGLATTSLALAAALVVAAAARIRRRGAGDAARREDAAAEGNRVSGT